MSASSDGVRPRRIGEVIETSTVSIWAESDRLHELPPLGSVVQVATRGEETIYAVVAFGQTTGIDATRRAVRRGSDELRDGDVYRRHPELSQILRTTFETIPVAYERAGRIYRLLPPVPPPLHFSVAEVSRERLRDLTDDPSYLSILAQHHGVVSADQLIAAHVRAVGELRTDDPGWTERAAQAVARLFKRDYDRLLPILEALEPSR